MFPALDLSMRWTVIEGDCLEVLKTLPAGSVDAVITDPPYGIGGEVVRRGGREVAALPRWDRARFDWLALLPPARAVVSFCDRRATGALWEAMQEANLGARQCFYWIKSNPPPQFRGGFQSSVEAGIWATPINGKRTDAFLAGGAEPNVWHGPLAAEHEHPTQKPLPLMRWLVLLFRRPNDLILDPFCGSGTTGIAAIMEGRRFLGIEREAQYCAIARRRIADAAAQTSLFDGVA
jgi:DNA modification methylase